VGRGGLGVWCCSAKVQWGCTRLSVRPAPVTLLWRLTYGLEFFHLLTACCVFLNCPAGTPETRRGWSC
jgi:hypothetical protein